MATPPLNIDEQKAVDRFRTQVVEPSRNKLVILDFWAEWCGPCKALTPILEKVAAEYADKGVMLAKVNVDEEKFIASQFQVQSIPTVYAIFQGQPVADLTPARSESELKKALDEILKQIPVNGGGEGGPDGQQAPDIDQLVAMGEQVLAEGDHERAIGVFAQIAQMAPDNASVQGGLLKSLIAGGMMDEAKEALTRVPEELKDDPAIVQAATQLELAGEQVDDSELAGLRSAAQSAPDDMDAQMAFAEAAFAAGERDEASATLLTMIQRDPEWNEGAAKAKLLQFFEAVGLEDPWVSGERRKLSLLLFG